jgi:hypothetical protein
VTAREAAVQAEIREAKADARLRVLLWTGVALMFALLIACLVYTIQAAKAAEDAAHEARNQSKANSVVIGLLDQANATERSRFQALLDTVYGPGVVTLGNPATSRPVYRSATPQATDAPKPVAPEPVAPAPAPKPVAPAPAPAPPRARSRRSALCRGPSVTTSILPAAGSPPRSAVPNMLPCAEVKRCESLQIRTMSAYRETTQKPGMSSLAACHASGAS